jgi:DNA-binding transcriptional LysR family regulator
MTSLEVRYFLGVVENGLSFTKAAESLYVSQPDLSKHITKLGQELGCRLLDTSRKREIELTEAGKLWYDYFVRVRNEYKKTAAGAEQLARRKSIIRFAALRVFDFSVFNRIHAEFRAAHPEVEVSVVTQDFNQLAGGLLNGEHDVIVAPGDDLRRIHGVKVHDCFTVPLVLLVSSANPLSAKPGLDIFDFKDENCYTVSREQIPAMQEHIEAWCAAFNFSPHFVPLPNLDSVLSTLLTGQGYAILNGMVRETRNPIFRCLRLDESTTIGCAWLEKNPNPALPLYLDNCILTQNFSETRSE